MAISKSVYSKSTHGSVSATSELEWVNRLSLKNLIHQHQEFADEIAAQEVIDGLSQTPKTLPAKYFYDDRGSELFEQICDLPEYYITRTEAAILQQYADEIVKLTGACELVELGSGSSTKTRMLLDAYQRVGHPLHYCPIDISGGILEESAKHLLMQYPSLKVHGLIGTYELGLEHLSLGYFARRMISFLGSSLGNLNAVVCDRFFDQIAGALRSGDFFLLGVDLHKDTAQLEAAYNDSQGVTAAFNMNMLRHLNHRFNGNFDLTQFEHWAFYNTKEYRVEMHLRSRKRQTVILKDLDLQVDFAANETIHSEISRKFDILRLQQQLATKGLHTIQTWTDANQWFAVMLFQYQPEEPESCG